jgi:metal-responsive CopG/Arc/MetJ family transcriptional regulator
MRCAKMKAHIGLTIDKELLNQIESLRGREKRSTFVEHLLRLGLEAYTRENSIPQIGRRRHKK